MPAAGAGAEVGALTIAALNWLAMAFAVFLPVFSFDPGNPSLSAGDTFLRESRPGALAAVEAATFAGWMAGATLISLFSDGCGRKPACLFSGYGAAAVCLFAAPTSVAAYAVARGALGFCVGGLGLAAFSLGIELFGTEREKKGGWGSVLFSNAFAIGGCLLPLLAYFVRNWRTMTAVVGLVQMCITTLTLLFVPESPAWLASKAAGATAHQHPSRTPHGLHAAFLPLFKPPLSTRLLLLLFIWFTAVHVYYGTTLDATNLGDSSSKLSLYTLSFLLNLSAIPAQSLSAPLISRFTAPKVLAASFLLSSAAFFAAPFLGNPAVLTANTALNLAFCTLYSASSTLFPTPLRNTALGLLASFSKSGAILAPWMVHGTNRTVPFLVFGTMCAISGVLGIGLGLGWAQSQDGAAEDGYAVVGQASDGWLTR